MHVIYLAFFDLCFDYHSRVISLATSYSWGNGFKSRPENRLTWLYTEVYRGFPQSVQAIVEVVGLPEIASFQLTIH